MDAVMRSRVGWKERQLLTPMWIGFAVVFVLLLVPFLLIAENSTRMDVGSLLLGVYFLFGCTFCLAVGIFLYSPERELGTDQLLASFPVRSGLVASTKLLHGAVYCLAFILFAVLTIWLARFLMVGDWGFLEFFSPDQRNLLSILLLLSIPLECFLWSALTSQLFDNPLKATLIGALFSVLGIWFATFVFDLLGFHITEREFPYTFLTARLIIGTLLVVALLRLNRYWLRRGAIVDGGTSAFSERVWPLPHRWLAQPAVDLPRRNLGRVFGILVWQSWRTLWLPLVCVLLACLVYGFCWFQLTLSSRVAYQDKLTIDALSLINFYFVGLVGTFLGLQIFAYDQIGRRYRFFQQQGEFPRLVWLSRMMILAIGWLFVSAALLAPASVVAQQMIWSQFENGLNGYRDEYQSTYARIGILRFGLVYLMSAAIGQFFSMFVRSTVLIFPIGAVFCIAGGGWLSYLIVTGMSEEAWNGWALPTLYGIPIIVAFLTATWWYAPRWLADRRPLLNACYPIVAIVATIVATVFGLQRHRLNDIELPSKIVPVAEYQRLYREFQSGQANDQPVHRVAKLYLAALAQQVPLDADSKTFEILRQQFDRSDDGVELLDTAPKNWSMEALKAYVTENREAIKLATEASRQPTCCFFLNPNSDQQRLKHQKQLLLLLNVETVFQLRSDELEMAKQAIFAEMHAIRHLGMEARLSGVLQRLFQWAQKPGQTPESLKAALAELDTKRRAFFAQHSKRSTLDYLRFCEQFDNWRYGRRSNIRLKRDGLSLSFPWEVQRSKHAVLRQMNQFKQLEQSVSKLADQPRMRWSSGYIANKRFRYVHDVEKLDHTCLFESPVGDPVFDALVKIQLFRYAKLRLALAAYRLEHGEYPNTLGKLAPDYIETVPTDTFVGGNFAYFPEGLEEPAIFNPVPAINRLGNAQSRAVVNSFVEPGTPFLVPWWSPGRYDVSFQLSHDVQSDDYPQVYSGVTVDCSFYRISRLFLSFNFTLEP